jgi:hypothetical protein
MKIYELTPIFCKHIPNWKGMEQGILYISEFYEVSNHLCACGCGQQTVLPFTREKNYGKNWSMTVNSDSKISFLPSIGNFSGEKPYHAHYYITENKIIWC